MLTSATLTAYLLAVATIVSALISQVVKPLVERVPALSPSAPDQTLHNWALRLANLVLTVIAVLILVAANGQLTLANLLPTAEMVAVTACGSHAVYQLVSKKSPALSSAAVQHQSITSGAPTSPLHQQAAPPAPTEAI
ncbi:MAG TPA: hypothetical protein VKQ36_02610 [Ktedonobacterales bacterium]|nr:hypothetical protein [Ktedonobacterales bacterium]